jgi:hypothetical protein
MNMMNSETHSCRHSLLSLLIFAPAGRLSFMIRATFAICIPIQSIATHRERRKAGGRESVRGAKRSTIGIGCCSDDTSESNFDQLALRLCLVLEKRWRIMGELVWDRGYASSTPDEDIRYRTDKGQTARKRVKAQLPACFLPLRQNKERRSTHGQKAVLLFVLVKLGVGKVVREEVGGGLLVG